MQRCALVLLVCIALVAPPRLSMRASSLIAGPSPGTPPLSERDDLSTWQIIYACSWDYQFYNGFEGWAVGDWDEADACYHWDDDTDAAARYYLVHAMHCADCQGDCFSPNCANTPQTYADNMEAYAQRRIDLSGWSTSDTISAKFYLWYDTEQNYDWVRFLVSDRDGAAGSWRELRSWSGQHRQWELVTINLSEYAGQSDIWICFKFDSDGSVHGYEGAYVDELLITGERSTARPDLAVPQIDWTPSAPKVGDSVRFQVHLANQGSSNTSPWGQACVSLFIDGTYLHDECVANVSPGTNEFLDFYWTATAGDHTIRAVADYGNFIPESNESNNERQETLRTACPAPANLSASPSLGTIRLDWQDNCSNEDSFKIYRDGSLVHTVGAGSTSWVDTGLPGGIQRCYYIVAHNAAGDSARSNTACATPSSPCPAPANVTAVALSRSSIKIDWQDNCGDEDSFRIYRDGSQVYTAGSGTTSWTDTGLASGRRYCYTIIAHNPGGDSPQSNSACATTPSPCPAPAGVTATPLSRTSIRVDWQDNCSSEDSFRIYRDGSWVYTTGAGVTSWTDTGLAGGTQYCYYIIAHNSEGDSPQSSVVCATTRSLCPAPGNVTATPLSVTSVRVNWQDTCNTEDSFKVYRNGSLAYTAGPGVTSWTDTGLSCGTQYCYYVVAHNSEGDSQQSNTACATPQCPCPAPANVTAVALSRSSIKIDWQDNCGDEDSFRIYRDGSQVHTAGSGTTSWTDTGLVRGRRYCYAIVAHNAQGDSAGSNSACATTHTASVFLPFVLRTRSIWGQISFPRASPK